MTDLEREALRKKRGLSELSQKQKQILSDYLQNSPYKQIDKDLENEGGFYGAKADDFGAMLEGRGKFRGSDRYASNLGESLDSVFGAPARTSIDRLQKGNIKAALVDAMAQVGRDPEEAPTGVDIASKVTDNPYLGAGLATAVDLGAQVPMPFSPGVPGVIKKLDGPLFHGSPHSFPLEDLRPSRGGYVGPGVYMVDTESAARQYGDEMLAANPKKVNILDLMSNEDDVRLAAKELGVEDGLNQRLSVKGVGSARDGTGRFYALQDALIEKIDPDYKLVGNERAQALIDALKERGYTGIKYDHNSAPAYNIFDAKNLRSAHKYTVRNRDGEIKLYSEPAQASGTLLNYDSVNQMDPEVIEHLEKLGASPEELFRLETLNSDISGYGAKALKKMEESAKKRGAEYSYLNAAPMGLLGIPQGMNQETSAAKLRDYYQKQGYDVVKDYGTNTMMVKKLKAQLGANPADLPSPLISAIRQKREEKNRNK